MHPTAQIHSLPQTLLLPGMQQLGNPLSAAAAGGAGVEGAPQLRQQPGARGGPADPAPGQATLGLHNLTLAGPSCTMCPRTPLRGPFQQQQQSRSSHRRSAARAATATTSAMAPARGLRSVLTVPRLPAPRVLERGWRSNPALPSRLPLLPPWLPPGGNVRSRVCATERPDWRPTHRSSLGPGPPIGRALLLLQLALREAHPVQGRHRCFLSA